MASAASIDPGDVAAVARLRKGGSPEEVRVALRLAEGRRRLAGKVADPSAWLADSDGAQMATDARVAAWKATRFMGLDCIDLCSGIGADARELRRVAGVRCVDIDLCRAAMCEHNTGCSVEIADAAAIDVGGRLIHIDPARRSAAGRTAGLSGLEPGPEVIRRLVTRSAGACVKLMPGVDLADLDAAFGGVGGELEHISFGGRMTQAAWWTGSLADAGSEHRARATMVLPDGSAETLVASPAAAGGLGHVDAWLYAPDPAAERAGLLAALAEKVGSDEVFPGVGVLTSSERIRSPWLAAFRVIERLPYRESRVASAVAAHGGGIVAVKTRGGAVDPDVAQVALRGPGDRPLTVFVLRFGSAIEAIIADRSPDP